MNFSISCLLNGLLEDAYNPEINILTVLRKAKLLACELGDHDFSRWIDYELKGYPDGEYVPDYRIVTTPSKFCYISGTHKVDNQSLPIKLIPENYHELHVTDGLATLIEYAKYGEETLCIPYPSEFYAKYSKVLSVEVYNIKRIVRKADFIQIIENVKDRIINFLIEIRNIHPEYYNNSEVPEEEKEEISTIINYIIMGDFNYNHVNTIKYVEVGNIESVKNAFREIKVPEEFITKFVNIETKEDQKEVKKEKINEWFTELKSYIKDNNKKIVISSINLILKKFGIEI